MDRIKIFLNNYFKLEMSKLEIEIALLIFVCVIAYFVGGHVGKLISHINHM